MSVREKSARLLLPCIAAGAVGCAQVGPDFVPPRADVTETWQQIEGDALKPTAPELVEWWRVFDDPILDDLVEATYRENKTLEVAGLRVLEARAQLGIAVGNQYPQLQRGRGGAVYVREHDGRRSHVLAVRPRGRRVLGARLLGTIPPGDRVRGRQPARLDRQLR
jgi:hypothetical protein